MMHFVADNDFDPSGLMNDAIDLLNDKPRNK
jgi:hypothetical protein